MNNEARIAWLETKTTPPHTPKTCGECRKFREDKSRQFGFCKHFEHKTLYGNQSCYVAFQLGDYRVK